MPDINSRLQALFDPDNPNERCGFILKRNVIKEIDNVHPDPLKAFEIDAKAIIEHEDNLKGTWHTHPTGRATLSEEDYTCFLNWPNLEHYIIAKDGVSKYIVEDGVVLNAD